MKRILSFAVAIVLLFSVLPPSASADELENAGAGARLMPVNYTYTDVYTAVDSAFVGFARFDVTISGVVDANNGYYVTVSSASCRYRQGLNCTMHDMDVETWTDYSTGTVSWKLVGTLSFSWTDPVFGLKFETVHYESSTFTFDPDDYI